MLPHEAFFCVWMVGKSVGSGRTRPLPVSVFSHEWCSQVRAEASGVVLQDSSDV